MQSFVAVTPQCHISRDKEKLAHVASVNTKDTGL